MLIGLFHQKDDDEDDNDELTCQHEAGRKQAASQLLREEVYREPAKVYPCG